MWKNIFEGAKFGDKFITREGKILYYKNINYIYVYLFDKDLKVTRYFYNGSEYRQPTILCKYPEDSTTHHKTDIVSRYKEPIDENKIDELAKESYGITLELTSEELGFRKGYKAGYRKAKEEN